MKMISCVSNALSEGCDRNRTQLQLITYLVPNLPVRLFEIYQEVFEKVFIDLCSGSRLTVDVDHSSPLRNKIDPFTANEADIGFLCACGFVRMVDEGNEFVEFLPVLPLFKHQVTKTVCEQPYHYSQVIIHKKKAEKFKYFHDLKGHRWGMNHDPESFTGNIAVLAELRKFGFNSNFFGSLLHTGSHLESIAAVVDEKVDGAAVDSNVLQFWIEENPENQDKVSVLCTWGPWPLPPIVVNSRLPDELKTKMVDVLLNTEKDPELAKKFAAFGIQRFTRASPTIYSKTRDVLKLAKNEVIYPVYY